MRFLTAKNLRFAYELLGEGPGIALTSGGMYPMEFLLPLARNLAADFKVLVYDRRNTGRSEFSFDPKQHEFEHFADDLYCILRKLDMIPCHIGGGSVGAIVSLIYAYR